MVTQLYINVNSQEDKVQLRSGKQKAYDYTWHRRMDAIQ